MTVKSKLAPVNAPRDFAINELFFSTTTDKGIIVSGNAVFARVSQYPLTEMIGKPHNLIRHPDMPRAVFKLLWDYLLAGKPIASYVKNMASDGRYYWVLALAAPIEGGGFLSVRFKPSSPLFGLIADVYAELSAIEQAAASRREERNAAMAAAEARLGEILKSKGFAGYDAFMRTMLYQELQSRDSLLVKDKLSIFPPLPLHRADEGRAAASLRSMYHAAQQTYGQINALYGQLDTYTALNTQLSACAKATLSLTKEFRSICLNLTVTSCRLGEPGRTLRVIATHLEEASSRVGEIVAWLMSQVDHVSNRLGETTFSLAWARLQFEMVIVCYHEVLTSLDSQATEAAFQERLSMVGDLRYAFGQTIRQTEQSLDGLAKDLSSLTIHVEDLRRAMLSLQVSHVGGLVEACRLTEEGIFSAIFEDIAHHIQDTKKELAQFNQIIGTLSEFAQQTPRIMHTISGAANQLRRDQEHFNKLAA